MMDPFQIALSGYLAFGQLIPVGQQQIVKHAGLQVLHADGAVTLRLKETARRDVAEPQARHVVIDLRDEAYPFYVTRHIRAWQDGSAVETWLEIRHGESAPVRLLRADSLAVSLPIKADCVRVMSLAGCWGKEANVRFGEVAGGQSIVLLSRSGTRDAWESNVGMMVSFDADVDEENGRVLGVALEWTGSTARRVRRGWSGSPVEIFAGLDMTTGPYTLDPGVTFVTPRAVLVGSDSGRGLVSRRFHRWARHHLMPHGTDLRAILLNSWEGSYFSFTEKTLTDMMDGVREMGGEMFVLDDGWFGKGKYARNQVNQDKVGLGDWFVNPEKLPRGLGYLAAEANKRNLTFGFWVEPEMVNTRSWLAEAHPDWLLREAKRPLALGRGGTQLVLDFANPAVRDDIWDKLDAVFTQAAPLAYVKWDCNQDIVNPGSTYLKADRQPNLWYDYTRGLYDVLARCRAKRPDVLIQACASGGGHADFGMLRYCDEFWGSDCTDPLQRVFIQWGESQFYPANAIACHVTASPNHQTKRVTPLKYRFDVAMSGRMGFELHPKDLSADEFAFAKRAVAFYKRIRPVVQQGDLYRLASPYENTYAALDFVDEARTHAVAFVYGLDKAEARTCALRPRGLDPKRRYAVREANVAARAHLPSERVLTGEALMRDGLPLPLEGLYDSVVLEISKAR